MSFEPLKQKLLDRNGRQVADSVQATIVRAFERAAIVPDANIDYLVRGAARVISDGRADKPDEYATTVLGRIAWRSQRQFVSDWQLARSSSDQTGCVEATEGCSSAILADIEVRQLLDTLDDRDRSIFVMRSRGCAYREIAAELGMLEVTARCRYHLARTPLRKLASRER